MEQILHTENAEQTARLFGNMDVHVRRIEERLAVRISNRGGAEGDSLLISGEEQSVMTASKILDYLLMIDRRGDEINDVAVGYAISMVCDGRENELMGFGQDCLCISSRGKPIKAKTVGQKQYVEKIEKNTVVFGVGPAGTGKTFLAVAMAVKALREKRVNRIILTRPAIEAGEKLGFLPGDLQSKIDPYLRPLYDALYEMVGMENYQKLLEKGVIEIAPLAYMRGRTLDDSFIILDEAQNATPEQMKMFLTRLGFGSRMVVTGDLTQTDLPFGQKSGLAVAVKILDHVEDIAIHAFTERDVVRHKLVQKIILAYEKYDRSREKSVQERQNRAPREDEKRPASPRRYFVKNDR